MTGTTMSALLAALLAWGTLPSAARAVSTTPRRSSPSAPAGGLGLPGAQTQLDPQSTPAATPVSALVPDLRAFLTEPAQEGAFGLLAAGFASQAALEPAQAAEVGELIAGYLGRLEERRHAGEAMAQAEIELETRRLQLLVDFVERHAPFRPNHYQLQATYLAFHARLSQLNRDAVARITSQAALLKASLGSAHGLSQAVSSALGELPASPESRGLKPAQLDSETPAGQVAALAAIIARAGSLEPARTYEAAQALALLRRRLGPDPAIDEALREAKRFLSRAPTGKNAIALRNLQLLSEHPPMMQESDETLIFFAVSVAAGVYDRIVSMKIKRLEDSAARNPRELPSALSELRRTQERLWPILPAAIRKRIAEALSPYAPTPAQEPEPAAAAAGLFPEEFARAAEPDRADSGLRDLRIFAALSSSRNSLRSQELSRLFETKSPEPEAAPRAHWLRRTLDSLRGWTGFGLSLFGGFLLFSLRRQIESLAQDWRDARYLARAWGELVGWGWTLTIALAGAVLAIMLWGLIPA